MLNINDKAIEFSLPDQNGNIVNYSDYKGKKIVLYFYPKDNTSGCSIEAQGFKEHINEFKALGYEVIGVSKDSVESHKKFECKYDLPFTLLSDTNLTLINAYGVYGEKKLYGKPYMGVIRSTFVIDENGIIIKAYNKVNTKTHALDILNDIK